jgi:hypothetical protein
VSLARPMSDSSTPLGTAPGGRPQTNEDLRDLFHRLNNQLGIILAHAELLEAKGGDEIARARAGQVVASVLDAMGTAREIRNRTEPASL